MISFHQAPTKFHVRPAVNILCAHERRGWAVSHQGNRLVIGSLGYATQRSLLKVPR